MFLGRGGEVRGVLSRRGGFLCRLGFYKALLVRKHPFEPKKWVINVVRYPSSGAIVGFLSAYRNVFFELLQRHGRNKG